MEGIGRQDRSVVALTLAPMPWLAAASIRQQRGRLTAFTRIIARAPSLPFLAQEA
jgi:hypothetical protein